jgi:hypothetical protein
MCNVKLNQGKILKTECLPLFFQISEKISTMNSGLIITLNLMILCDPLYESMTPNHGCACILYGSPC